MKLHYFKGKSENFGDDINPWFWDRVLGDGWDIDNDDDYLIGIGTLLNDRLPQSGHLHILGSGAGYGRSIPELKENWTAHFVRGPLTAKALGVETSRALIDPVFMLERWVKKQKTKNYKVSFIPHIGIDSEVLKNICLAADFNYISPQINRDLFIDEINRSEKVITSAMHGAIVADALRVPWAPIITSNEILAFKWHDFSNSLNLQYEPTQITTIWPNQRKQLLRKFKLEIKKHMFEYTLRRISKSNKFNLSNYHILDNKLKNVEEVIAAFKETYLPNVATQS